MPTLPLSTFACIATLAILPAQQDSAAEREATLARAIDTVREACVYVEVPSEGGGFSAVFVQEDGLLLTAGHCVNAGEDYLVHLADGRRLKAVPLGADQRVDMGMIRLATAPADPMPTVALGRSASLATGQQLFSIGFPGDPIEDRGFVVRYGKVVAPTDERGFIQSTVLMEPGDSGGPLFDLEGRLVGIHSQIAYGLDTNMDTPIDAFKAEWDALLDGAAFSAQKRVLTMLGVELSDSDDGPRFSIVRRAGTGFASGLRIGDLLLSINDRDVNTTKKAMRSLRRAWRRSLFATPTLEVQRGSKSLSLQLDNGARTRADQFALQATDVAEAAAAAEIGSSTVVQVGSEIDGKRRKILGTVVSAEGLIVSKASEVGTAVEIQMAGNPSPQPAVEVARDEKEDIVLLLCSGLQPRRWETFAHEGSAALGSFLRSPIATGGGSGAKKRTAKGIVSTRIFRMPKPRFVIGVRLARDTDDVAIEHVFEDSPAARAGLQPGDKVLTADGKPVATYSDLVQHLGAIDRPRQVLLSTTRDGVRREIELTPTAANDAGPDDQTPGGLSTRNSGLGMVFCHDTPLRPEQCGGPLLNRAGQVVGLNIARASRTQALALPNFVVRRFIAKHRAVSVDKK